MAASNSESGVSLTSAEIPGQIDLVISLRLHLWPALTITIQNGWGTSNPQIGEDKRDWLAGAVSDLFAQNQLRDLEDLEDVLEQVMNDEFEVVIDDGSLEEVAEKIWRGVERVKKGDGSEVRSLMTIWEERKKKGDKTIGIVRASGNEDEDRSTDGDDDDEDNPQHISDGQQISHHTGTGTTDVDMDDAPAPADASNRRVDPEVDEDGFTKVVSRKKR